MITITIILIIIIVVIIIVIIIIIFIIIIIIIIIIIVNIITAIEELKQRITTIAAKIRRYQGRLDSYRQNRRFENNQRQFYGKLDQKEKRGDDDQPAAKELKQFCGNILSRQPPNHKKGAKWLQDLRSEVNVSKQEKIDITIGSLKKILRMSN